MPAKDGDALSVVALRKTLEALASSALEGREPETDGDDAARALIEARMRAMGLAPAGGQYQHAFTFGDDVHTANVVGALRGGDESLAHEVVVVGAHHDHLGVEGRRMFRGANDNASGVSVMLGVAADLALRATRPRRTVVFVAFGAEEEGLYGSLEYVRHPPDGLSMQHTVFMLNLDMVGSWSSDQRLYALHTFRGTPGHTALQRLIPAYEDLRVEIGHAGEDSDHESFCAVGVPTAFFYTPDARCYHRTCDVPERIEWEKLARIAQLTRDLVVTLADADDLATSRAAGCGR